MIEVDEDRAPRTVHVTHPGGGGYIVEPFAFAIMQQIAAAVGTDRKQVGPAVVVVVRERRDDCTGGQRERHVRADVRHETAVNCVKPRARRRGNQEIVLTVAVVVSPGQRRDWTPPSGKPVSPVTSV